MRHPVVLIVLVFVALLASHPALAQFSQQGPKLVGNGFSGPNPPGQGYSVAVSADGYTAIVGGPNDGGFVGAAWIWVRHGKFWVQQGPKLLGQSPMGTSFQGRSVALSADGNTAIVGGPGDDGARGAVWIYTRRSDGYWIQFGHKLVSLSATPFGREGTSVAISADGKMAVVGAPGEGNGAGAVHVWDLTLAGLWQEAGFPLVGTGATGSAAQGGSVSLSADGTTVLAGGTADTFGAGAVWVWTRVGKQVLNQQGPKLVGSGAVTNANQGKSVALSADGNTAIVGGPVDTHPVSGMYLGAAWIWTRSGGVWTQQGAKLLGSDSVMNPQQGAAVSISGDGNTVIVGGPGDGVAPAPGAAWIWTRTADVWSQQGPKHVGTGGVGVTGQGASVALSGKGYFAIVGGPSDVASTGAAWMFATPASAMMCDFDGDGWADRTVIRPSSGVWYSALSNGTATATGWGVAGDSDVAADYDGDGKVDIAIWRTGTWFIRQSSDDSVHVATWGMAGDFPLAGDLDGDFKADLAIWRPSTGAWFVLYSTGGIGVTGWGIPGDQPLLADFDNDQKLDLVIYRPATGVWYIALSGGGSPIIGWGAPGDVPVVGDFDGDGRSDTTVFRPSTGQWFVKNANGDVTVVTWGQPGDIPVSGDWDGNGRSDYTVWRPSNGGWYTQYAGGGTVTGAWGIDGDKPICRLPGS